LFADLKQRWKEQYFKVYPEMIGKTIRKLLIIIPKSCTGSLDLNEPGKIEFTNRFLTRMASRAGNVARDYKSSIYKFFETITDPDGKQVDFK